MRELDPRLDLDFIISRKTRISMQTARGHLLSKGNCVIASTSLLFMVQLFDIISSFLVHDSGTREQRSWKEGKKVKGEKINGVEAIREEKREVRRRKRKMIEIGL